MLVDPESMTMAERFDVVVVGGGIAGLAQAWAASRAGRSVVVLEQSPYAQGASIRNFGMVCPVCLPAGVDLDAAMRSRSLWLEASEQAGFASHTRGMVFLATREDEWAVLREFCEAAQGLAYDCEMLGRDAVRARCPAANGAQVVGGMYSKTEVGIDPRGALPKLAAMLSERHGVRVAYERAVVGVRPGVVTCGDGGRYVAGERVVVCGGAQTRQFYPEVFAQRGVRKCKLQMLSTAPQPGGWSCGPMVAGGLALRHYASFAGCASLPALKARIVSERPELERYGIHVLAAQHPSGEVVLGDSHEYGQEVSPFDREDINTLILRELRELIELPDWTIRRRWHGVYLSAPGQTHLVTEPEPGVTVFGVMGLGMTLAFGLAERMWGASLSPAQPALPSQG
ncbi:TIGR03364 family FAD-dependent oxidoreductase [Phycisphaeraceae bacterium D3-23]